MFPSRVIEAAKRFRFDEKLGKDPVEYQKIYEELRVEAALLAVVCIPIIPALFRTSSLFCQNSPYAEVRAVVDNHDDPAMPASTFRAWFIGTIFVAAGYVNNHCILRAPLGSLGAHLLTDYLQRFYQSVLHHSSARYYGLNQCRSATRLSRW